MCRVGDNEKHKYNLTIAIAELYIEKHKDIPTVFGIIYPSSKMFAAGDNLALMPVPKSYENIGLNFKKTLHVRIDDKVDTDNEKISITNLDHANSESNGSTLSWLGRLPHLAQRKQFESAEIVLEAGIDKDGDYQVDANGVQCNWVVYDGETQKVIEPF